MSIGARTGRPSATEDGQAYAAYDRGQVDDGRARGSGSTPTASPRTTTWCGRRGHDHRAVPDDEATALGDTERVALAEADRDYLVRELARAVGLGGRHRVAGSTSERARASVTRALRYAVSRIGEHHRSLGDHLEQTLRTGTYCSYVPDPRLPTTWEIER